MVRRILPIVLLALTAVAVPGDAPARACADGHIGISLAGFPSQAISGHFYWLSEDSGAGSFVVRFTGSDCPPRPVSAAYRGEDESATSGADYAPLTGRASGSSDAHPANEVFVPISVINDGVPDLGTFETTSILLHDPQGGTLSAPFRAPLRIVDANGLPRVALEPGPYRQVETFGEAGAVVYRAGLATDAATVQFSIAQGSARAGEDYVGGTGAITIPAGARAGVIPFRVIDDRTPEGTEELTISITGGASVDGPSSATFTIVDNEESGRPESRLHHPRHRARYRPDDYRLREIHVFTEDIGAAGVSRSEFALRRNESGGRCSWWTGRGWRGGGCKKERWLPMRTYEPDFFYYRIRRNLPPSVGRVQDYTAFSRAIDGSGNRESGFKRGRNANTFEVVPGK